MFKYNRETAKPSEKKDTKKLRFYYILTVSLFTFYMTSLIIYCIPEIIFQLQDN